MSGTSKNSYNIVSGTFYNTTKLYLAFQTFTVLYYEINYLINNEAPRHKFMGYKKIIINDKQNKY